MPKATNAKAKKRGPKEDKLIIREDPEAALRRLLKPTTPPKRRK